MKIVKIEAIPLRAPADKAIAHSQAVIDCFYTTIVRITTDDGVQGIGECMCRTAALPTKVIVDEMLAPRLLGKDPLDVESLWQDMFNYERHRGHAEGLYIEAISGVDAALWDLIARYHHMSLGKLLGGCDRKIVPAYASAVMIDSIPEMARRAQKLVDDGFRALKIKIGRDKHTDIASIRAIRQAVGDKIDLMVDANSHYSSVSEVVYVGKALQDMGVLWFEEPVMPDSIGAYQEIASKLDMAVAAGESCFTSRSFLRLFTNNCIELAQPDITRCGGVTESRRIAELAMVFDKQYAPHTGFSSSVCVFGSMQLAAWAPNFVIYEYGLFGNPLQRLTVSPVPEVKDGMLEIPQGEGICCELDESFIKKYRMDK